MAADKLEEEAGTSGVGEGDQNVPLKRKLIYCLLRAMIVEVFINIFFF